MKGLLIRQATNEDLSHLVSLYHSLDSPEETRTERVSVVTDEQREIFARIKADEHQEVFVAELEGEVTGTFILMIIPNLAHGCAPWALVENVVVHEAHRGTGIGTAMMQFARARAARCGCYKIVLSSNVAREQAHRFYEELGWRRSHYGFTLDL